MRSRLTFALIGLLTGLYLAAWAALFTTTVFLDPVLADVTGKEKLVSAGVAAVIGSLAYFSFRFSRGAVTGRIQFGESTTKFAIAGLLFGSMGYLTGAIRNFRWFLCPLCPHIDAFGPRWPLDLFFFGPLNSLTLVSVGLFGMGLVHLGQKLYKRRNLARKTSQETKNRS